MPLLLAPWLTRQRWYAAKGSARPDLVRVGGTRIQDQASAVGIEVHVVRAETGPAGGSTAGGAASRAVYQVPLTYRATPEPELEPALIGVFEHPDLGDRWVYDGPHDPAFVAALLTLLDGGRAAAADGMPGGAAGVMQRIAPPPAGPAEVLRGEQSNTSIIVDRKGPDPLIVKLFRVLQAGPNPDVVVQSRLAAAGCLRVPQPVGRVEGSWADPSAPDGVAAGHLAYACEFVADGEDAWRVACRAVESGESFAAPAGELGRATAEVHTLLARAMPTRPADGDVLDRLADGLIGRVEWAVGLVPALEPFAAAARARMDAVRGLTGLPPLQQVHGDYHLGQVLHSPSRGWVVLDFEGEPLRPMADRLEPDLALRDVAGMLRSFDYAAGHATVGLAADDPRLRASQAWSEQASQAFLAGYVAAGGHAGASGGAGAGACGGAGAGACGGIGRRAAEAALLRALELDKAMYEVVYETLNRPSWVEIPLAALARLTRAD
jgi:predicted trehalose synthase